MTPVEGVAVPRERPALDARGGRQHAVERAAKCGVVDRSGGHLQRRHPHQVVAVLAEALLQAGQIQAVANAQDRVLEPAARGRLAVQRVDAGHRQREAERQRERSEKASRPPTAASWTPACARPPCRAGARRSARWRRSAPTAPATTEARRSPRDARAPAPRARPWIARARGSSASSLCSLLHAPRPFGSLADPFSKSACIAGRDPAWTPVTIRRSPMRMRSKNRLRVGVGAVTALALALSPMGACWRPATARRPSSRSTPRSTERTSTSSTATRPDGRTS